ncbi:Ig-like domain-containing protein, partial [Candidatus Magnetaquicoccus inordinatus]|uniref:Ig-like domain-containing protein n=1 Tax=Candidatus Magnetaquicoccus inordinatus TaxID=2496818 RepID=UPI00187D1F49
WQFAVSDGAGGTIGATTFTLSIQPVNDAPQLSAPSAPVVFIENGAPTPLFADLFLADVDSQHLQGATVAFTHGFLGSEDQLSFTAVAGITGSWEGVNGRLHFVGSASLSDYQTLLRSVGYQVSSAAADNPTVQNRLLQVSVNDGQWESLSVNQTLQVQAANDAPRLLHSADLAYSENDPASPLAPDLLIIDPDSQQFTGALVRISGGYLSAEDRLAFHDQGGIHGSWNSAIGELTLSGSASFAQYQSALRSVTYINLDGATPSEGSRTVRWQLEDGLLSSDPLWSQVQVTAVNDAPQLSAPASLTLNEDQTVSITGISVQDVDVDNAVLELALSTQHGSLTLAATSGLTWLAGSNGNPWLRVTGSLPDLQQALLALQYRGAHDFNGNDQLTIQISDWGHNGSGAVGAAVHQIALQVLPVQDAPVAGADAFTTEEDSPLSLSAG